MLIRNLSPHIHLSFPQTDCNSSMCLSHVGVLLRTLALNQPFEILLFAYTSSDLSFLKRIGLEQAYKSTVLRSSEALSYSTLTLVLSHEIKSMADEVNRWQTSWQRRASCSISCENKLLFRALSLSDSKP